MSDAPQSFGPHLRAVRESHKRGLRATARATDVSPTYLSRIETGHESAPPPDVAERIIAASGATPDEAADLRDLLARERCPHCGAKRSPT